MDRVRVETHKVPFGPGLNHLADRLEQAQIETLGRYNAEVGRGIVHTDQWKAKMAELQARFDGARS